MVKCGDLVWYDALGLPQARDSIYLVGMFNMWSMAGHACSIRLVAVPAKVQKDVEQRLSAAWACVRATY